MWSRRAHHAALIGQGLAEEQLKTLIHQCWHPHPGKRPGFEEIVAELCELQSETAIPPGTGAATTTATICSNPQAQRADLLQSGLSDDSTATGLVADFGSTIEVAGGDLGLSRPASRRNSDTGAE